MTGNCGNCRHPGPLYEQETGGWLCDECTALAELQDEQEFMYERETRRRGHSGHNDPRIDYTAVEVAV